MPIVVMVRVDYGTDFSLPQSIDGGHYMIGWAWHQGRA